VSVTLRATVDAPVRHVRRFTLHRGVNRIDIRGEILENAAQIWNYNFDSQNARQRYGEAFISQLANWRFAGAHPEASNSKCAS